MAGRVEVPRSPLRAPTYGLVVAARDATNDPGVGNEVSGGRARWESGLAWQPNCAADTGTWRDCIDSAATQSVHKTIPPRASVVDVDAFALWSGDVCSTLGGLTQDRVERATEQLTAGQSMALESILQDGLAGITVPHLRDGNVVNLSPGATSSPLVYGLAALEEAAADVGTQAWIYATVTTVTLWYSARAIERTPGGLLVTALGTIVVPGRGFTGANPAGTVDPTGETAYAYVTGQPQVRLGEVSVIGDERSIDRAANTWEVRAERMALVTFEPCIQAGVNVNLCSTFCVPKTS